MLTVIILKRYSKYTEGYERGFRVTLSQQPRYNCRDDFDMLQRLSKFPLRWRVQTLSIDLDIPQAFEVFSSDLRS